MWAPFCSVYAPVAENNEDKKTVVKETQERYQTNDTLKYDLKINEEK